ncbi:MULTISPECIES: YabP/YqfC family sporulation protein [Ruminococcus]|uniref:YabP family protein n=1 Tax=Ruminococcus flavefaciens TaxID=1265 RepID=A0A1M7KVR5_RUMFL|nr:MULTISPECIES: YabP/YqfC family sporulation protein [Ruminococcus]MCR4793916.1 YabP/YqfC family sporulation protein [Ruminococcus sp.]SHM69567.1 YabP family protein [Ruminococcus flavefaciens]
MFDWLAELTRDTLYLNSGIHISDNKELIIDNCRRIEEYNEVYMRLVSGRLYISIHGNGLRAFDFRTGGLVIRGYIEKIEFAERSKHNESENKRLSEDKRTGKEAL